MGAQTFQVISVGATAEAAFSAAIEAAKYERGHGGYTGTIAEKRSFVRIERTAMSEQAAAARACELMIAEDVRVDDKWGPAGCIPIVDGRFLFFGWASS